MKTLALFLPGIFLLGMNIGTGSVTSMAKAGATYGMDLLWAIGASCLTTFFLISIFGKFTLVTGETALQAFRKHIHPGFAIFFIVALTFGVSGSVMGVMGIVAEICFEWSKTVLNDGIAPIWWAILFTAMVYYIFWMGKTKVFERALAIIVAVMSACFLLNLFFMFPPIGDVISGMIPSIPEVKDGGDPMLLIAATVGTTVFSGLFIIRTTLVKEAGWDISHAKQQRNDAIVSATLMFIISAAIMAAAAGSIYAEGKTMNNASEMIAMLEPLAGQFATTLFALGIVAAGVSSQFPNALMLPWLLCDYNNTKRDMSLNKYRIIVAVISLLGLVVPIFGGRPILIMIVSQALNAFILPATVGGIIYLTNKTDLMKSYKNNTWVNLFLGLILAFSLFTSYLSLNGVIETISNLINN
ncbi:MAG: Nramp family divalent metal transporter [Polaribacter sp.]